MSCKVTYCPYKEREQLEDYCLRHYKTIVIGNIEHELMRAREKFLDVLMSIPKDSPEHWGLKEATKRGNKDA